MQANYTASGIIHKILEKEQRGNYTIQKVVLEVEGFKDRKEFPTFEFFGAKSAAPDPFNEGDECEISFNLSGRESGGRWFSTLSAWKIVRPEQPHQRGSSVDNRRREQSTQEDTRRHYPLEERAPNGRREPAPSSRGGSYKGVEPDEIEF